jgi:hypothetical protein
MRRIRPVLIAAATMPFVCAATALATIPNPGQFSGTTSQLNPDGSSETVEIKMTHQGHKVRSFDIAWLAPCDNGFTTLFQGTHAEGSVTSRGKFHGHGTYFADQGNLQGTPYTATVTDRLKGRFVSKIRAKGTFEAVAILRDAGGQPVSTCTTPTVVWHAKHR